MSAAGRPVVSAVPTRIWIWALLVLAGAAGVLAAVALTNSASADPTCSIYWTGTTSTSWDVATNWSSTNGGPSAGRTPGATDFVCMSTAPHRAAVVVSSADHTIAGINFARTSTVTPSLELLGGTFTINTNASTINDLRSDGATVTGSATVTVTLTGAPYLDTGSHLGLTEVVPVGATLGVANNILVGSATTHAALQIDGSIVLAGGGSVRLASVSDGQPGTLVVNGAMTMGQGSAIVSDGDAAILGRFINNGTLTTAAGSNLDLINSQFTNTGAVNVAGVELQINGDAATGAGNDTGTWSTTGAEVLFEGTRTLSGGSITGPYGAELLAGSLTFGAGYPVSALDVGSGTLAGSPTVTNLSLVGGDLTGTGTLTVPSGATATLCGVTLDGGYRLLNQGAMTSDNCSTTLDVGTIENAGSWTVTGPGSRVYNTIASDADDAVLNDAGANLTVSFDAANDFFEVHTPFTNAGALTVTSGGVQLYDGNVTSSTDTGTTTLAAGTQLVLDGGSRSVTAGSVTGAGTLTINRGSVAFADGLPLASFDLEDGSVSGSPTVTKLVLNAGTLTGTGTLTIPAGGTATLCDTTIDGGYRLLNQGSLTTNNSGCESSLTNGGVLENARSWTVTGGNAHLYADDDADDQVRNDAGATLTVSLDAAGTLWDVEPAVTNSGTLKITKGTVNLQTLTNLSATGTLTGGTYSAAGGTIAVPTAIVTNAATVSTGAAGAFDPALSSVATNSGTLTVGSSLTADGSLANSGTLNVTGSEVVYGVGSFSQSAGSTTVGTGAVLTSGTSGTSAVSVAGGTLSGRGTVRGAVAGAGSVSPGSLGSGTLTVTGSFAPTSAATTPVTVGSSTTKLAVSGAATLAGTLAITTKGTPAVGSAYTVLTAGSVTGTFAGITGQTIGSTGRYYAITYTSTSVVATVRATVSVSSVSPAVIGAGATRTVTISGSNFQSGAMVSIGTSGVTATVSAVSGTSITASLHATATAPPGATTVTVTNPDGSSGACTNCLTVDAAPKVTAVSPSTLAGKAHTTVTLTGLRFAAGAAVSTNSASIAVSNVSVVSSTSITATFTVVASPAAGAKTVTVTNPDGGVGTCACRLTLTGAPTVTSVTPATLGGGASRTVTVTGSNFEPGASVTINSSSATASSVTYVSTTQLTATVTVVAAPSAGSKTVLVTNPDGSAAQCSCLTLTAGPKITTISPSSVARGTTTTLTITGSGFSSDGALSAPGITFGGVTVVNATTITATATVSSTAAPGPAVVTLADGPAGNYGSTTGSVTIT